MSLSATRVSDGQLAAKARNWEELIDDAVVWAGDKQEEKFMIRKTDYTQAIQTLTHSLAVLREAQEVEQNLEQLKAERDRLVPEIEALRQQEAQEAAQHEASMAQRQREERETTARLAELHMKITDRTKVLREVNRAVAEIKKHLRAARPEWDPIGFNTKEEADAAWINVKYGALNPQHRDIYQAFTNFYARANPSETMVGNFDADTDPVVAETLKGVPPAQPAAADDATRKVVDALSQQHGWGTPGSALSRITGKICTPHMSILLAMTKQLPRELMFRKAQRFSPRAGNGERLLSDRLGRAGPESMALGRTQLYI